MGTVIWTGAGTGTEAGRIDSTNNWSTGALPTNGDDVFFEGNTVAVDVSVVSAFTNTANFASFNINQSYTGTIGAKTTPLQLRAGKINVGYNYGSGNPAGSGRLNLQLINTTDASNAATIVVYDSAGTPTDSGLEPIRLKLNNASSALHVMKGKVGVATSQAGETASLGTVYSSFVNAISSDATVHVGPGVTLPTFKQTGGSNSLQASVTTLEAIGGVLTVHGSATASTVTIGPDATVYLSNANATATNASITTLNVAGTADFTRDSRAKVVTNCNVYKGFVLKGDCVQVTFTNGIDFQQCDVSDGTLELGNHFTLTPSAI